jgi:uncharacterized protein (DUF1786 family)
MIDIGAGTMDVLYYDTADDRHFKAVVMSPVRLLAQKAAGISGDLVVTGCEMGGGPLSDALRTHARTARVMMTHASAATLHHDPDRVQSWGIDLIDDADVDKILNGGDFTRLDIADLDVERMHRIVDAFGVPFRFDAVAVCAQDHGVPPKGVSHLDYRHNVFRALLAKLPCPHALLFGLDEIPASMNRLKSLAASASGLPADEIYVMDSGMAAMLGASMDNHCRANKQFVVLDIATSHTVAAAMQGDELAGFFEYHTHDITRERLEALLFALADGNLTHEQILAEGGHGAYLRQTLGFHNIETIVATGPKRRLLRSSKLPMVFGAPLGDNMMTGTVGLLEALRRRKDLEPIVYL